MRESMSLVSDVEALARALGVWWDPRQPSLTSTAAAKRRYLAGLVVTSRGGQLLVQVGVTETSTWEADAWTHVDAPTLALILLGHARGLRVDIGECPACRERGSNRGLAMWSWHTNRWSEVSCRQPLVETYIAAGWTAAWVAVDDKTDEGRLVLKRPCDGCTVDGEPTGHRTVAWERAVVDAMSKYTDTRTPLAVLADQLQARGDILGTFVAEWLAGPCPACEGVGRERLVQFGQATNHWLTDKTCKRCHGHGTMLGQREPELRACLQVAAAIAEATPDERATVTA